MTSVPPPTICSLLRQFRLLAGLPESDLNHLAAQCQVSQAPRDQAIFHQGDPCDRVWLVSSGQVKIVYHEDDGREVVLEMIAPGEAFGGAVLFFPTHPATAKAMEDTELVSLPREVYAEVLTRHPAVTLKLLHMLGARQRSMIDLQVLAGARVERRLAHILLKLADRVGRQTPGGMLISIPLSRQDLADMSGTTLETAIRTISRLTRQGIISTERGGYLVIHDLEKLTAAAQSG